MRSHKSIVSFSILLSFMIFCSSCCVSYSAGGSWHTHDVLIGMFKTLCDNNPSIASYEVIGKSYQNRDIYLFKFGNPEGGKVMWDAALHGWEDMGSEIQYLIAQWLLTSQTAEADRILERNYILFVPIVNIDSYERENKDYEQDSWGVDLNRNFVTGFNYIAPANTGFPNSYHGAYGGSEKETQAVRNALSTYRPEVFLDMHYGGSAMFNGNNRADRLATAINSRIAELVSETGLSFPWNPSASNSSPGNGFATADAYSFGATTWLMELASESGPYKTGGSCYAHTTHTYADVQSWYFPRLLLAFRAMTGAVEIIPPVPPSGVQSTWTISSYGTIG